MINKMGLYKNYTGYFQQGWKMYRTTGPMVPENFWVYQKIFRSKKELLTRHKDKFLIGRKYIELENEKN